MQIRFQIAGLLLAIPLSAVAANLGEPDPELLLGPLQTYATEAAARAACGGGQVVWAERYAGYFYKPGEAQFGVAAFGAYACAKNAAGANYWDSDPMAGVMGYRGKTFRWPDPVGS